MSIDPTLSDTELYIMEYLWTLHEPQSFAQLLQHFTEVEHKDWKKQTLNTFLLRLTKKGFITTTAPGFRRLYAPAMTKEAYHHQYARQVVDNSFGSSITSFLSAFTGGQKITEEEKNELMDYLKGL